MIDIAKTLVKAADALGKPLVFDKHGQLKHGPPSPSQERPKPRPLGR